MSFSQKLLVQFQLNFVTLSVLHISSMCQNIQKTDKLLITLLEVKVDYTDYSLRRSNTAPTFKEQCFLKVGAVYDPRKL